MINLRHLKLSSAYLRHLKVYIDRLITLLEIVNFGCILITSLVTIKPIMSFIITDIVASFLTFDIVKLRNF